MNIEIDTTSNNTHVEFQSFDEYGNRTVSFVNKDDKDRLQAISDEFIEVATQIRPAKDVDFVEKLFNELLTSHQKEAFLDKYVKPYEI